MRCCLHRYLLRVYSFASILVLFCANYAFGDINFTILVVNGTDEVREKTIEQFLPEELTLEDILDTQGLDVDYDVNERAYYVHGKVTLAAKDTKTIKIRIRDLWTIEEAEVDEIKHQIDSNFKLLEGTEYYEAGKFKKENLYQRLDYIVAQQERYSENIGTRIDRYRAYADELKTIRENAVSVKFWRAKSPGIDSEKLVVFIVELENPLDVEASTSNQKHYLPKELKPEHILDTQGFEIGFDEKKGTAYLVKDEILGPKEKKRYEIRIVDIWKIDVNNIENLKNRTREAFRLLEQSRYAEGAAFLVKNIKVQLGKIEVSQNIETTINEHIGIYRANEQRFAKALSDVEILEELVEIIREELERSKLKNVLQKIRSLKGIAEIAKAIFGVKPSSKTAWKIIIGIIAFVGAYTAIHFIIWGRRLKEKKLKDVEEEEEAVW